MNVALGRKDRLLSEKSIEQIVTRMDAIEKKLGELTSELEKREKSLMEALNTPADERGELSTGSAEKSEIPDMRTWAWIARFESQL